MKRSAHGQVVSRVEEGHEGSEVRRGSSAWRAGHSTGCTPDWARENETGVIMEIAEIIGAAGATGGPTATSSSRTSAPVFNDDARVTVERLPQEPDRRRHQRRSSTCASRATRSATSAPTGATSRASTCPTASPAPLTPCASTPPPDEVEVEADVIITSSGTRPSSSRRCVNLIGIFARTADADGAVPRPAQGSSRRSPRSPIYGAHGDDGRGRSRRRAALQVTFADFADAASKEQARER